MNQPNIDLQTISYGALCAFIASDNTETELKLQCTQERNIRNIVGSGVELGKAFIKGNVEMHVELGKKKAGSKRLIETYTLAIDRTDSKLLTTALKSAIKQLEKML